MAALVLNEANTFSQTPVTDSRVIDSGICRLEIDQRGMERPYGDGCDIGAIEYSSDDVVVPARRSLLLPMIVR